MNKLLFCEYNMDTACVELKYDRSNGFYRRQLIQTTREKPSERQDAPDVAAVGT